MKEKKSRNTTIETERKIWLEAKETKIDFRKTTLYSKKLEKQRFKKKQDTFFLC